jgi:catechol 2,3-dioxygenase-like lactoylglutathione lyase family enzyme
MGVDLKPLAQLAILETALYAPDLAQIVEFYRRVLGMEPYAVVPDRHVFYKCSDQMLLFFNAETTKKPGYVGGNLMPPHGVVGEGHVCFRASAGEIDQWRARLQSLGIEIESDFEWPGGGHSIYFRDPAGNLLEFAEPRIWGLA